MDWTDEQWEEWYQATHALEKEGRWEEVIASCDEMLARLDPDNLPIEATSFLTTKKTALTVLRRFPEAVACAEERLRIAEASDDRVEFLMAYHGLAWAHGAMGNGERLESMLKSMFRYISGPSEVAYVLDDLTWCCKAQTSTGRALELLYVEWALLLDPLRRAAWSTKYRGLLDLGRVAEVEAAAATHDGSLAGLISAEAAASALELWEEAARLSRALAEAARAEGLNELARNAAEDAERYPRIAARKAREREEGDA